MLEPSCHQQHRYFRLTPSYPAPAVLPALEPPAGYDDQQQQLYRYIDEQQQRDLMLAEDMLDLIRGMAGQDADNQVRYCDIGRVMCDVKHVTWCVVSGRLEQPHQRGQQQED
jgi:hypothetical protein